MILAVALTLSSCKMKLIPTAINTVNSVGLEELNLQRNDYVVQKTITAEAAVIYNERSSKITISDQNREFTITYKKVPFSSSWACKKFEGVAKYGFLHNDYLNYHVRPIEKTIDPANVARNVAIYRIINACKVSGGDGVIEPIVSMNAQQIGNREVLFTVTVSAKVIKLKTDK